MYRYIQHIMLTPNNFKIPVNCISCSLFTIFDCSLEMKQKLTLKTDHFVNLFTFTNFS